MKTNELIDRTVKLLDEARECYLAANPYLTDEESDEFAKDYQYYESVLSTLSRTRIRETAKEPPAREDADRYGYVLAFYSNGVAGIRYYAEAVRFPSVYPHWTQLPEVTE